MVCTIVRVAEDGSSPERFRVKPSDMLPWADPYICQIVKRLQREVRMDRQLQDRRHLLNPMRADLDPPSPATDTDWDWNDEPNWTRSIEPSGE